MKRSPPLRIQIHPRRSRPNGVDHNRPNRADHEDPTPRREHPEIGPAPRSPLRGRIPRRNKIHRCRRVPSKIDLSIPHAHNISERPRRPPRSHNRANASDPKYGHARPIARFQPEQPNQRKRRRPGSLHSPCPTSERCPTGVSGPRTPVRICADPSRRISRSTSRKPAADSIAFNSSAGGK
jgi:hypothetical protein